MCGSRPSSLVTSGVHGKWHHCLGHMCGSRPSSLVTSGVLGKVTGDTSLVWVVDLASRYISHIGLVRLYPLDLLISFTLMYGALLPLFQKGVIIIMRSLLMISLASYGYILWRLELRCLLPTGLLLQWFAYSMALLFLFFMPPLPKSTYLVLFVTFFLNKALFLSTRAHRCSCSKRCCSA
jgi:hypothetical protein